MSPKQHTTYPCVKQPTAWSCGACCLLSLARWSGNLAVTLESLLEATSTDESGTSLSDLERVAREKLNLSPLLLQTRQASVLAGLNAPCVLPLQNADGQYHFVVIYDARNHSKVLVADPAVGIVSMSLVEIEKRWSGELLLVDCPVPDVSSQGDDWIDFARQIFAGCQSEAIQAGCILLLQSATSVAALLALRWLIVATLANTDSSILVPALVAELVFALRLMLMRTSLRQLTSLRKSLASGLHQWMTTQTTEKNSGKAGHRSLKDSIKSLKVIVAARESLVALLWVVADIVVFVASLIVVMQLAAGMEWLLLSALIGFSIHGWFSEQQEHHLPDASVLQFVCDTAITAALFLMSWQSPAASPGGFRLLGLILVLAVVRQPLLRLVSVPRHVQRISKFIRSHGHASMV